MKEIKAYIRRTHVNRVVRKLEQAGAPGITIVEVHPVGYGYEPNYFERDFDDPFKRYKHLQIIKVEIACSDDDVEKLVQTIQSECRTGDKGDGIVFVSEVVDAVRIRDGLRGPKALEPNRTAPAEPDVRGAA